MPLAPMLETSWAAEAREFFGDVGSAFVDRDAALGLLERRPVPSADIWALAALVAWEGAIRDARQQAMRHGSA